MNIIYTLNIIATFILQSNPILPNNGNNTDIDAPIDDYINLGIILAIVMGFIVIHKMRKSHSKV
jgi:hypothetical protein